MKQQIKFSIFSQAITFGILILFVVGTVSLSDNESKLIMFCIIMGLVTITGLYFCPKSIEATESEIVLHKLISHSQTLDYEEIESVKQFYPTVGIRLCGSGGFFGYWGYFRDLQIGAFIGFYGSSDNCFLVKMKDGRQYVLGCKDANELIPYIQSHLF
ncbi:MAG: PH domain-containing protein [Muribaculaceae bacterium]|nr:PH domain-containing protein [Muribaculaceae bacterium]